MKKEELFTLVKSLSRSEKRYFKLFASQNRGSANYVKLFDILDKQTEFDEAEVRKKFKGEPMLNQLHVTKNYLRQLILKSLRNFHSNLTKDAELKDILRNVEILFQKELYIHCETEIRRAERIAEEYELLTGQVEISNWKRKLEQAQRPQNYEGLHAVLENQKVVLDKLKNTHEYWETAVKLSGNMFGSTLNRNTGEPHFKSAENAQTMEAKVLFFNTLYLNYMRKRQGEKGADALRELITYLEQFPKRVKEDPGLYLSSVNNLVSFCFFNKKYNDALKLLRHARAFTEGFQLKSERRSYLKQVVRSLNIELEIYRTLGTFDEHVSFISDMEKYVNDNRLRMPADYRFSFWFQFAYIAFMRKDFDAALHWVNLILNTHLKHIRLDLQTQARFLNLMIHLERGNLFVLRYFVDSTRRFLKKRKDVQPYENILLRFFSKMGRLPESEWNVAFKTLEKKLYPKDGTQVIPDFESGYIDYRKWIAER